MGSSSILNLSQTLLNLSQDLPRLLPSIIPIMYQKIKKIFHPRSPRSAFQFHLQPREHPTRVATDPGTIHPTNTPSLSLALRSPSLGTYIEHKQHVQACTPATIQQVACSCLLYLLHNEKYFPACLCSYVFSHLAEFTHPPACRYMYLYGET